MNENMKMSAINFDKRYEGQIVAGQKTTTVRLGQKPFKIGIAAFLFDKRASKLLVEITEVRQLRFGSLSNDDARDDGFNSLESLRVALSEIYGRQIHCADVITQVRFEVTE
ncbi:ASCH domain-containing protein [Psychrosphaera sp. 1_MG-2023]|uniref:ASCH domain-containing protein n=1 Tax=Psychrosphaera sp. 1_MG-2023 TaxID=3062643 RepID=UPI0026E467A7|nr:ASCH domain-containing protein [Psychrosphaera sp. 1_MG-2023]MDO6718836.1 ASCH domain-containing protein [Psychrosphaera sp. 1_MG-2023]